VKVAGSRSFTIAPRKIMSSDGGDWLDFHLQVSMLHLLKARNAGGR